MDGTVSTLGILSIVKRQKAHKMNIYLLRIYLTRNEGPLTVTLVEDMARQRRPRYWGMSCMDIKMFPFKTIMHPQWKRLLEGELEHT